MLTSLLWTETVLRVFHLVSSCSSKYELLAANKNLKENEETGFPHESSVHCEYVVVLAPAVAAAAHSSGLSGGVQRVWGWGIDLLIRRSTSTVAPSFSPHDVDGSVA